MIYNITDKKTETSIPTDNSLKMFKELEKDGIPTKITTINSKTYIEYDDKTLTTNRKTEILTLLEEA